MIRFAYCSEVCRINVVRSNAVFTSVSTYSTNTTLYKKNYIKDKYRGNIAVYKENFKLFGTIVVVVCSWIL